MPINYAPEEKLRNQMDLFLHFRMDADARNAAFHFRGQYP